MQNDAKRMPPPKSVAIKKRKSKRPQDFLRRASAPADRSPDKRKSAEIVVTGDSDSDTACGFGTNWQPSWLACRVGDHCIPMWVVGGIGFAADFREAFPIVFGWNNNIYIYIGKVSFALIIVSSSHPHHITTIDIWHTPSITSNT